MGLNDLDGMDVPDNKGGRPSKTEEDSNGRKYDGDALTLDKDSEDWWRVKFNNFKNDYNDVDEAIQALSDHVAVFTREVRVTLDDYGIYETDWEEWIEQYPTYKDDGKVRDKLIKAGIDVPERGSSSSVSPELESMFGGDTITSGTDNNDEPSDGLESLF